MKSLKSLFGMAVLAAVFANTASAQTIVAHKVKIRLKQVLEDVTGGHFAIGIGVDTASHAQIEFQDNEGRLVARPFPVQLTGVGVGLQVVGEVDNNQLISMFRTNGKSVLDLTGRYMGARLTEVLFWDRISSRSTLWMNGNHVILAEATRASGLGGGVSFEHVYITPLAFTEASNLPGDWHDTIVIK